MEWPDLLRPATSDCELAGPKLRRVLLGDINDREATEILRGVGIPTFAKLQFATNVISTESLAQIFIYSRGEDEHARFLHLGHDCPGQRSARLKPLFGVITDPLLVEVDNVVRHVTFLLSAVRRTYYADHRLSQTPICAEKSRMCLKRAHNKRGHRGGVARRTRFDA